MIKKLILTSTLFIFVLGSCSLFKNIDKPGIAVKFDKIKDISIVDQSVTLLMNLAVTNPWPANGSLKNLAADFIIEGTTLSKLNFTNPKANANTVTNNPFDLKMKLSDLQKIYNDFSNRENINYTVKGSTDLDVPGYGLVNFPLSFTSSVPAINIALDVSNFKVGKIQVAKRTVIELLPGLSLDDLGNMAPKFKTDLTFDLNLKNKTKAILKFANLKSDFFLGDYNVVKGGTGTATTNQGNNFTYQVKNTINLNESLRALISRNRSNYKWDGAVDLELPGSFGTHPVSFTKNGDVSW